MIISQETDYLVSFWSAALPDTAEREANCLKFEDLASLWLEQVSSPYTEQGSHRKLAVPEAMLYCTYFWNLNKKKKKKKELHYPLLAIQHLSEDTLHYTTQYMVQL